MHSSRSFGRVVRTTIVSPANLVVTRQTVVMMMYNLTKGFEEVQIKSCDVLECCESQSRAAQIVFREEKMQAQSPLAPALSATLSGDKKWHQIKKRKDDEINHGTTRP
jgi:hypothetical protein